MKKQLVLTEMDADNLEAERMITRLEAKKRFMDGVTKHGEINILTDERDYAQEALEEVYDAINYLHFLAIKIRKLKENLEDDKKSESWESATKTGLP